MQFNELVKAGETIESITQFVEGGTLLSILDAIGDIHFAAAKETLRNARHAADTKAEYRSAKDHLIVARNVYRKMWQSTTVGGIIQEITAIAARSRPYDMECVTCCLIALCYEYLGDRKLSAQYLDTAGEVIEARDRLEDRYMTSGLDAIHHIPTRVALGLTIGIPAMLVRVAVNMVNPLNYVAAMKAGEVPYIQKTDLFQLQKVIDEYFREHP